MSSLLQKRQALVPAIARKVAGEIEMLESGLSNFEDFNFIALTNLYLLASYCYYEVESPAISDGLFDELCVYLADNFEALGLFGVRHVGTVIVKDNLDAGTCLGVEYPEVIKLVGTAYGKLHGSLA